MAHNKLALIRYKIIDECLKNRFKKWTLDDLIEAVSEALYEYENIKTGVSKRTIQSDIQMMRSDKLGYNAPIIVVDKKYYTYAEKDYSIMNAPINAKDVEKMQEVVSILKQFTGFSYFEEMTEMVAKLENHLYTSTKQSRNCIQFESNRKLKGIEYINPLYQAILHKKVLAIEYQSFKAKASHTDIYYPYLLKEYRNRWFLIAKIKDSNYLITRALDRVIKIEEIYIEEFVEYEGIDFDAYYSDLIGVSKSIQDIAKEVVLFIDRYNAPYVKTKPLHPSQKILEQYEDGSIKVRIEVILNFELEREILGFGNSMKVLSPIILVKRIKKKLFGIQEMYS